MVQKRYPVRALFVVGADGHHSHTRQVLGIGREDFGSPELYSVFEFATDAAWGNEARMVLGPSLTSVLWPLPGNKCRWSFQRELARDQTLEFPHKQRRPVRFYEENSDRVLRDEARGLLADRAPWFEGAIGEFDWTLNVQFGHSLAERYGRGRCWLAGDAAHQTSPAGMQSMNAGLREADAVAGNLRRILREGQGPELMEAYGQRCHQQWQWLLGAPGWPETKANASVWAVERRARLLSCLPATGEDLSVLLSQAGLEFPSLPA
jgi:2-polyprenyl-6-methoxyphenol hydroxylase-like FAD-dependent oxidoreductase